LAFRPDDLEKLAGTIHPLNRFPGIAESWSRNCTRRRIVA
jgi:hypothetical protein